MQNLANQKLQLKQLVTGENGIAAALESIKLLLPAESPKYNAFLQLEADFNQLKLNDIKGIISEEQFRIAINQIRERLIQLIDLLDAKDFEQPVINEVITNSKKTNYLPYVVVGVLAVALMAIFIWKPWKTTENNSAEIKENAPASVTEDSPAQKVVVTEPEMILVNGAPSGDYYIGKYEVTVAEFKDFIDATNYQTDADKSGEVVIWRDDAPVYLNNQKINWQCKVSGEKLQPDNHPVIFVSRNDAVAYAEWLSQQTGKTYRLPTEADWTYAASGGNKSQNYTYYGSNNINEVAWYNQNSYDSTQPVGQKKANELGIYDMNGNVWEWCNDWYKTGESYVARGGGWTGGEEFCRPDNRAYGIANSTSFIGFRLVRK